MRPMTYKTIESTVGHTPLVRLQRLPGNTTNTILVKLEGNTPHLVISPNGRTL
ncbi:MAG: hypothetical protein HRT34_15230, partial [Alcanivorax sp.]|nr:hypothetical protein [Alcanivorax sp.]